MSEELIVRHCSPTLAGLKTGNLFSCDYSDKAELMRELRRLNTVLASKGIRIVPMRVSEERALIYVYRPDRLKRDMRNESAATLLQNEGYPSSCIGGCVAKLASKLQRRESFPHEIGLFLGYPPEDVIGFIENKAENFKCCGFWKVYGDEERAVTVFDRFRKCKDIYVKHWLKSGNIEKLAVGCPVR